VTEFLELVGRGLITQNLILLQGLGMYALTRHTKTISGALKAGVSMLAAMLTAGLGVWFLSALAIPESLSFFAYLVVASLAAFLWQRLLEMPDSFSGGLMDSALLGMLLLMGRSYITGFAAIGYAVSAGLGYLIVLLVIAFLRHQLQLAPIPKPFKGVPLVLITAGLLGMALLGFKL
jgi:electron transport complex protein RnfA